MTPHAGSITTTFGLASEINSRDIGTKRLHETSRQNSAQMFLDIARARFKSMLLTGMYIYIYMCICIYIYMYIAHIRMYIYLYVHLFISYLFIFDSVYT